MVMMSDPIQQGFAEALQSLRDDCPTAYPKFEAETKQAMLVIFLEGWVRAKEDSIQAIHRVQSEKGISHVGVAS